MSAAEESAVADVTRARRLALAFQSVFGVWARRSVDQKLVLEHLRRCCGRDFPVFVADKEGRFDPLRAAHLDGAQTQFLIIKRQLAIAASVDDPKAKKPTVKKT